MTTGSVVPQVIDALIAALQGGSFTVVDGPGQTDDQIMQAVFVGMSDPDQTNFIEAASSSQSWAWLGHQMRDERGSVHCVAEAWNGQSDMKAARDAVFAILNQVAGVIQEDPTLGGVVVQVLGISGSTFKQTTDQQGALAQLPFDVEFQGRNH